LLQLKEVSMQDPRECFRKKKMSQEDLDFLVNTDLFRATPEEAHSELLYSLRRKEVKAGQRFIRQGAKGNRFYLIHHGTCVISLEKEDVLHPVSRLKPGELVGEMAILTGENRNAHVDAETDMVLWGIASSRFEAICKEHPDVREFLTELVAKRFSKSKFTVDRAIGKYVIKDVIGQGGWSIVYRGVHSGLNMPVAIKMLKHDLAMDEYFSEKFQNEANVIARLNHDNIVRIYDIEYLYKTVFIIMEYLEGVSLEDVLDRMPRMQFNSVIDVLIQVCRGLHYAHSQGIVHQDIKPANIFLQSGYRARIVDFGLACPTGSEDETDLPGTPHYMSPEQIEGEPIDQRSDIYAIGITAYEMATGLRPFCGRTVSEILRAHKEEPVPDPRSLNPKLPPEFCNIIKKATEKNPKDRYGSVLEILDELNKLAEASNMDSRVRLDNEKRVMGLFVSYPKERQLEITQLMEDFGDKLTTLGLKLQVTDLENL
jgi:eukaryotic-like serine/threonine-protein kinase